jgi:ABC-type transporter Mla subunit MlaD
MSNIDHETIELILIAVTASAVLLQAFVLLAMFLALKKSSRSIIEQIEDLKSTITPLVDNARGLLERVGPKLEGTTTDVAEIVRGLKQQAAEAEASVSEILDLVRKQTSRIDEMISGLLNAVDRAGDYVSDVVNRPVRQISGVLASIKAIVESLRTPIPEPHETHASRDRETFI